MLDDRRLSSAWSAQIPGGAIVDAARSTEVGGGGGRRLGGHQRVRPRDVADFCRRVRVSDFAGRRELRAGPGDGRDQSRPCWPKGDQRAPWSQRGFRFGRHRHRGGGDGRFRHITFRTARLSIVAASMPAPALFALFQIRPPEIDPARAHGGVAKSRARERNGRSAEPVQIRATPGLRGLHRPFSARQCRHAAVGGEHDDIALEQVRDDPRRHLDCRASTHRRRAFALGGPKAQQWGRAPLAHSLLRRLGDPRSLFALSDQSVYADGRTTSRRRLRRGAGGAGSTHHR